MTALLVHSFIKATRPLVHGGGRQARANSGSIPTHSLHVSSRSWLRKHANFRTCVAFSRSYVSMAGSKLTHPLFNSPVQSKRSVTLPRSAKQGNHSRRSMFIRTESTPNPDSMKFMPDRQLLEPGQSIEFENAVAAARSPLAKMLFRNDMIQRVFLGSTFVTITKDEDTEWDQLKPIIFADLMEFLSSGEPILLGEVPESDTTIQPEDSEDVALIKTLLETRIRPSIQDDGGDLTYKGFIDGVVFLQLKGSCTSCPSSSVTLKSGIEKMLKHWSSAVISVVAVESEEEWEKIASAQTPELKNTASSTENVETPKVEATTSEKLQA